MKAILVLISVIAVMTSSNNSTAQSMKQDDFQNGRDKDFTKLIGGIQEGVQANYSSEKSTLEYSQGIKVRKNIMIKPGGSLGTTTNITGLFDQKVLPTYNLSLSGFFLIQKFSTWYYDGKFKANQPAIADPSVDITSLATSSPIEVSYRNALREKIILGKIAANNALYTVKSFAWIGVSAKWDHSKYSLYDTTRNYDNEVFNERYHSWSAKLNLNYYRTYDHVNLKWNWKKPRFYFISGGLQRGKSNNIQQLEKMTINSVKYTSISPTSRREYVETTVAYENKYREYTSTIFQLEFLYSHIRSVAISGSFDYNFIDKSFLEEKIINNYAVFTSGLYFYGAQENSKINIGIFYKWVQKNEGWDGSINLKTSIPIVPF